MKDYQKAFDDMKKHIIGFPILKWIYVKDVNLIQELIDEKVEQETRKDKLVAGSEWVCVTKCYGELDKYELISFYEGEIYEITNTHFVEEQLELNEYLFVYTQQFLLCFKPIKEGSK